MIIYKECEETMEPEARQAIKAGLFPGATVTDVWNPNGGPDAQYRTNIFLKHGEEFVSPVDKKTTLVGEFITSDNPLNGRMRRTHLSVKGE